MPYVQRDAGVIIALYANLQPGYAEEFLAADHANVLAYTNPAPNLSEYAATKRRALTNGSASINTGVRTIPVWVDPESRGSILGLVVASGIVPDLTAPWKGADGEFYTLATAEMPVMALGMMQFIQSCFATEAAILAAITAETITTTAEIDAAEWPT